MISCLGNAEWLSAKKMKSTNRVQILAKPIYVHLTLIFLGKALIYFYYHSVSVPENLTKLCSHWHATIDKEKIMYLPTPPPQAGCNTKSIFKQSAVGLNSEVSFS